MSALRDFAFFCDLLDAPELATDPRYVDFASRHAHRSELDADLARVLQTRTTAEWVERLAEHVPCGPVLAVDEVFADPQVQHLEMATPMHSPVVGEVDVVASAISITGFSKAIRLPTPEMSSSTDEVLASVGYSADEIADMRKKGAI